MNVLSLFDGISCGQLALNWAGINYENYFASEIDPNAIKVTRSHYPNTKHIGSVAEFRNWWNLPQIDLLIGGSPCQGFSRSGLELNFEDPRSKLFFDYVEVLNKRKPKYFLLENVVMKKEWADVISSYLGVQPIKINSKLVSAQNRERLYWTNIPNVTLPPEQNIVLYNVLFGDTVPVLLHNIYGGFKETGARVFVGKSPTLRTSAGGGHIPSVVKRKILFTDEFYEYGYKTDRLDTRIDQEYLFDLSYFGMAPLIANVFKGTPYSVYKDWDCIRTLHPIECERLQTIPDNYTEGFSNSVRYKMIGNGWTVDVISHILKGIKE